MNNYDIFKILELYVNTFPEENEGLSLLRKQLTLNEEISNRANSFGHVTASGLIVHDCKIALVFHNTLQKYIQPGGHIENDTSIHHAALREVKEETGMFVTLHPWHSIQQFIPIHIDIHKIPSNEKKQEQEHYHYDFVYVFTTKSDVSALQEDEVLDLRWHSLNSNFNENLLDMAVQKILKFVTFM